MFFTRAPPTPPGPWTPETCAESDHASLVDACLGCKIFPTLAKAALDPLEIQGGPSDVKAADAAIRQFQVVSAVVANDAVTSQVGMTCPPGSRDVRVVAKYATHAQIGCRPVTFGVQSGRPAEEKTSCAFVACIRTSARKSSISTS